MNKIDDNFCKNISLEDELVKYIKIEEDVIFYNGILIKNNNIIKNNNYCNWFVYLINKCDNEKYVDNYEHSIFIPYYNWCWNYHHNYTECLPNLLFYNIIKKNNTIKLTVPAIFLDNFYLYIFKILDIEPSECIIMKSDKNYIKKVYYSTLSSDYNEWSCNPYVLYLTKKINNYFNNITQPIKPNINKYIYINRLNKFAGANRYITNNTDIIEKLTKVEFITITYENLNLEEKINLINNNTKTVIAPIGANLVNMYFSNCRTLDKLILLFPCLPITNIYISNNIKLLCYLTGLTEDKIVIIYGKHIENVIILPGDQINKPYEIDMDELLNCITPKEDEFC